MDHTSVREQLMLGIYNHSLIIKLSSIELETESILKRGFWAEGWRTNRMQLSPKRALWFHFSVITSNLERDTLIV